MLEYRRKKEKQEMPLGVGFCVAQQGLSLGFCELLVSEGFLDRLSYRHLLWQQFLRISTPEFIAGCCII